MRYSQGRLGHLLEFVEGCRVSHELVVHVDEEVVPEGIQGDETRTLDVELKNGLQMTIQVRKGHLLGFDPVYFEDFGGEGGIR